MPLERADSSASALLSLVEGHRTTAVIYIAAKLAIADLLFDGPKTAAQLAHLTDTHERSLLRLMRGLVVLAICTETADGKFTLTEMGSHLAANSERPLKGWALFEGGMIRARWGELIEFDPHRQDGRRTRRARARSLRSDRENEGCGLGQRGHGFHDTFGDSRDTCRVRLQRYSSTDGCGRRSGRTDRRGSEEMSSHARYRFRSAPLRGGCEEASVRCRRFGSLRIHCRKLLRSTATRGRGNHDEEYHPRLER